MTPTIEKKFNLLREYMTWLIMGLPYYHKEEFEKWAIRASVPRKKWVRLEFRSTEDAEAFKQSHELSWSHLIHSSTFSPFSNRDVEIVILECMLNIWDIELIRKNKTCIIANQMDNAPTYGVAV